MHLNADRLRSEASKCRDLASTAVTNEGRTILSGLAAKYEDAAAALERQREKAAPRRPAFNWPLP